MATLTLAAGVALQVPGTSGGGVFRFVNTTTNPVKGEEIHVNSTGSTDAKDDLRLIVPGASNDVAWGGQLYAWSTKATTGTVALVGAVVVEDGGSSGGVGALAAAAARAASLARSQADRAANPSTIEAWSDLSAWAKYGGNGGATVQNGKVYSNGGGGGVAGINRTFVVPSNGRFRAVTTYNSTGGLVGSGVLIGVSSDAPGAAPAQYAASMRGLYFGDNGIRKADRGNFTTINDGSAPTAGVFVVTIVGNGQTLCVTARRVSDGQEWSCEFAQGDAAINNLAVFNTDTRGLSGDSVGKLGAKLGLASISPPAGIEDVGATVTIYGDARGTYRIAWPKGYDSAVGAPVAICHHGDGSDRSTWATEANAKVVADGLLAAGYVVLSASAQGNNRTWGSGYGVDAYAGAYAYLAANYTVGRVVFYANSMGGIESELGLAGRIVPEVLAWVGTSPSANFATNYANASFAAPIKAAYGIAADGSDYAQKTAQHDPVLLPGYAFRGVPMFALYATDDTTVPAAQNWLALKPNVVPYAKEIKEVSTTGGHGFDFTPYVPQIVAWFDKYAK